MKNIVIFCDGTWNFPDEQENGVPTPTNVVKLAQAVADNDAQGNPQRLYYDAGIGSSGSWLRRLFEGATGTGISENIVQAYTYLVHNFEVGDKLFLFGFSRGAFTVRSLAGLIRTAGILAPSSASRIGDAFALYRSRDPSTHPREIGPALFRRSHALQDITPIHFIGVWDTVGSLGNPLLVGKITPRNRFHDTKLSGHVRYAYHALAVDELRQNFAPTLWQEQEKQPDSPPQTLEQRWFVGVHSDVGGGYPEQELSAIPLDWLRQKASDADLCIRPLPLQKNPFGVKHESWQSFYRLIPEYHRPIGIDPTDPDTGRPMKTRQTIDESVWVRRHEDPNYRPQNLEEYLQRCPAPSAAVPA
jgi:uncharacterized protein (DUF2235 family)